uniref:Uncharacterized protein n=1 Tax=Romanomermis culicivorax TaxID=13658 RepID=A0A915JAR1_ROMCU
MQISQWFTKYEVWCTYYTNTGLLSKSQILLCFIALARHCSWTGFSKWFICKLIDNGWSPIKGAIVLADSRQAWAERKLTPIQKPPNNMSESEERHSVLAQTPIMVIGHNEYRGLHHNGWQVTPILTSALMEKTSCPEEYDVAIGAQLGRFWVEHLMGHRSAIAVGAWGTSMQPVQMLPFPPTI